MKRSKNKYRLFIIFLALSITTFGLPITQASEQQSTNSSRQAALDAEVENGLSYLIEKMKGQKIYAHINLEKGERSELAELASDLL